MLAPFADERGWRFVADSVCGAFHESTGAPCQDCQSVRVVPPGILIAAIADGAGSAPQSERGAQIAVQAAVGTLERICLDARTSAYSDERWTSIVRESLQSALLAVQY